MYAVIPLLFVPSAIALLTFGGLYLWIEPSSAKSAWGKLLSKDELREFFGKNLSLYNEVDTDGDMLWAFSDTKQTAPYIAKRMRRNWFCKYTISGLGQIPLRSPYTKILDRKFEELLELKKHV